MNISELNTNNLKNIIGNDYVAITLYILLVVNASKGDQFFTDNRGKKVALKKGQTVFGRNEYSRYLGCSPKTAERALSRICPLSVLKTTKQTNSNFTIVTIEDLLEENSKTKQRPSKDQAKTTSEYISNLSQVSSKYIIYNSVLDIPPNVLWDIAKEHRVTFNAVKKVAEDMDFRISEKLHKPYSDYKRALSDWVKRGIFDFKNIEQLDGLEWEIEMDDHEPSRIERRNKAKLKIKEDEKNGKPIFDLSRFRKQ